MEERERLDGPWQPSYLPEFGGDPNAASYAAYEPTGEVFFGKVNETAVAPPTARLTYGYGSPYR
jgi:hypothetical protein